MRCRFGEAVDSARSLIKVVVNNYRLWKAWLIYNRGILLQTCGNVSLGVVWSQKLLLSKCLTLRVIIPHLLRAGLANRFCSSCCCQQPNFFPLSYVLCAAIGILDLKDRARNRRAIFTASKFDRSDHEECRTPLRTWGSFWLFVCFIWTSARVGANACFC